MPVRVLIVDDHELVRRDIRSLLARHRDWSVCGEAADGVEATELARQLRPNVIFMDMSMPRMNGAEATRIIRREVPEAEVIIVTQNDSVVMREQASQIGARGYVSKAALERDLLPAILKLVGDGNGSAAVLEEPPESGWLSGGTFTQLAVSGDVSKAVIAERASALLAAIVDSSDDAIVSKNLDGVITSWNKGAERIFGYTSDEAVGRNISLIIPSDRLGEEAEILSRLRRGERVDHFETIRRRNDGTLINVSVTISPLKDAEGRVIGASKVARDITERKRAEERERQFAAATAAANAKFRAIFEQTTVFAGIMSKDGILLEANRLWVDACGYTPDEVLGKPLWQTSWWRNFPESQEKIRNAAPKVAQGFPYRETLLYGWMDGTQRILDFALYPIVDDNGQVLFLHPTGVDITEQKRSEENYRRLAESLDGQVRARTAELEERNTDVLRQSEQLRELSWRLLRMQDEERRHVARELHDSAGQLLAVLGMNLATIVDDARQKAPGIVKSAEQAAELVQQLTREIRTTSYLLHPPLLDENGLAAALSWYIGGLRERSGLDITLDIPSGFGRLSREMELVVFRLIQECLTNIHRHSGSKVAEIAIRRESNKLVVQVRDRGKGIPPQKLAEIRGKGSGVGIKGMSERLRQFNGEITIDSTPAGTMVRAVIPITQGEGAPECNLRFSRSV